MNPNKNYIIFNKDKQSMNLKQHSSVFFFGLQKSTLAAIGKLLTDRTGKINKEVLFGLVAVQIFKSLQLFNQCFILVFQYRNSIFQALDILLLFPPAFFCSLSGRQREVSVLEREKSLSFPREHTKACLSICFIFLSTF